MPCVKLELHRGLPSHDGGRDSLACPGDPSRHGGARPMLWGRAQVDDHGGEAEQEIVAAADGRAE
jgi:hypothetical protein